MLQNAFRKVFYFQMALESWKIILDTRGRYLKQSPNFKEYVNKKIRVIRRVEMTKLQEMDEKVENGP